MRLLTVTALLTMPLASFSENLLANPGFEDLDRAMPARWKLFVMPMEGAYGRLDDKDPHEGRLSAVLHNPEEYEAEPVNNWSQNIIADFGGKTLIVRGWIRTKNCTEAALWLQSCTRRPWRILGFATTSHDFPRYGTTDWAPVTMRVDVPDAADFVALRCVIKGRGTAWFDSVRVEDAATADDLEDAPIDWPDFVPLEPESGEEGPRPVASPDQSVRESVMRDLERLKDAHAAATEANRRLADTNVRLEAQIDDLRRQIETLRRELENVQRITLRRELLDRPTAPLARVRVPPLIPHGHSIEEYLR